MTDNAVNVDQSAAIALESPPEPLCTPDEPSGGSETSRQEKREAERARVQDSDLTNFLWNVHQYTNEYIRFADTKAAVIIVFDCSLAAALYGARVHERIAGAFGGWSVEAGASASAFGFLSLGITMAACVILPRLWNSQAAGVIFWEGILSHGSPASYWIALRGKASLSQEISEHLYALAGITSRKYRYTKWALFLSVAGVAFAVAVLLVS